MLYLIRHARTRHDPAQPAADWELDPAGLPALERLAASRDWDSIPRWYASTEPKAILTARALTRQPVTLVEALRELDRGGQWVADYEDVVRQAFAHPDRPARQGWETARQALERFAAAVDDIVAQAAGQDAAIVSHGLVLSLWLAHLRGQERVDWSEWRAIGFPDYAIVDGGRVVQGFQGEQPGGVWRG